MSRAREVVPNGLAVYVGGQVRQRRLSRNLAQTELARRVGVHRVTIAALEAGRQLVSLPTLIRLAEALKVNPAYLLPKLSEVERWALARWRR